MSVTRFVEIDRRRHNITDLPVIVEHHCDHDGEFIGHDGMIIVHGQVTGDGVHEAFSVDLHDDELEHAGAAIRRQIRERNPGSTL